MNFKDYLVKLWTLKEINKIEDKDKSLLNRIEKNSKYLKVFNSCKTLKQRIEKLNSSPAIIRDLTCFLVYNAIIHDSFLKHIKNNDIILFLKKHKTFDILRYNCACFDEETYLKILDLFPESFPYFNKKNSSYESVHEKAININPKFIGYISFPSEKLQMMAVCKEPTSIFKLDHPTLKVKKKALSLNQECIRELYQNQELCDFTAKHLKISDKIHNDLKDEKSNLLDCIKHKFRSFYVCKKFIEYHGNNLRFAPLEKFTVEQQQELKFIAVNNYPNIILYMDQEHKFLIQAVKRKGDTIQYIHNQMEELCLEALKQDYKAISFITNEKLLKDIVNKYLIDLNKTN